MENDCQQGETAETVETKNGFTLVFLTRCAARVTALEFKAGFLESNVFPKEQQVVSQNLPRQAQHLRVELGLKLLVGALVHEFYLHCDIRCYSAMAPIRVPQALYTAHQARQPQICH